MITRKNDAFVAKIVKTCLTKIFIAIFAPDERLPSSATLSEATLVTVTRLTQIPHSKNPNPPKTPGPGRGRHRPARDSRQGPRLLQPRSLPSLTYLCIRTFSSTSLNLSPKSSELLDVAWRGLLAANQSLRMCPIRPSWPAFGHQTWPWTQRGLICPWDSDAGHVFPLLPTLTRRHFFSVSEVSE